jgi:mannose-6-phosphate isomerase-like protein (cupin superfamily)
MTKIDVTKTRKELLKAYPGCRVIVTEDEREMIAEISNGFAVAVIERSVPHFHLKMTELYRVIRGTLHVSCAGKGYVLRKGETITIQPCQVHSARATGEPAWIEVESTPPWSPDDHFVL